MGVKSMERGYQQGICEADACRCELSSLPDDAARICFLKRHRRKLMTALHEMQEKLSGFYTLIRNMPGVNMGDALPGADFYYLGKQ